MLAIGSRKLNAAWQIALYALSAGVLLFLLLVVPARAEETVALSSETGSDSAAEAVVSEDAAQHLRVVIGSENGEMDFAPAEAGDEAAGHDEEAAGHDEEAGEGSHESGGFPQLDMTTYSSQIFWLFVSFSVLYFLMSRMALPGVASVLEARQQQKTGDLDLAAKLNTDAEKTKETLETALAKARDNAQKHLASADLDITTRINEANTRFGENARTKIEKAEASIDAARSAALKDLDGIAAELAAKAAASIANSVKVTDAQAKAAVETVKKEKRHGG